jgi:hypothetical protein
MVARLKRMGAAVVARPHLVDRRPAAKRVLVEAEQADAQVPVAMDRAEAYRLAVGMCPAAAGTTPAVEMGQAEMPAAAVVATALVVAVEPPAGEVHRVLPVD